MSNTKTKVCHLSSVHYALDTRLFFRQCKSLSGFYDVCLIGVHPVNEVRDGVRIIKYPRFRNKFIRLFTSFPIMLFKALRQNAALYHFHDPELLPVGLVLKALGRKVIYDVHENIADDIFDKDWLRFRKLFFGVFSFFEKLAARRLFLILAETSYVGRYRKMGARFELIYNYCDTGFFTDYRVEVRRPLNHLYYIGVVFENRGVFETLESVFLLRKKEIEVHFHCVGEIASPLRKKIEALPYFGEIKDQVHFYGRLPLPQGYNVSVKTGIGLCLIHPWKNATGSYPTKLFEYMAIGLPVIISDFELYREVVEKHRCGICIDPRNPQELVEAVVYLNQNPSVAEEMGKRGRDAVLKYFNWTSEEKKLLKVYSDLISGE